MRSPGPRVIVPYRQGLCYVRYDGTDRNKRLYYREYLVELRDYYSLLEYHKNDLEWQMWLMGDFEENIIVEIDYAKA